MNVDSILGDSELFLELPVAKELYDLAFFWLLVDPFRSISATVPSAFPVNESSVRIHLVYLLSVLVLFALFWLHLRADRNSVFFTKFPRRYRAPNRACLFNRILLRVTKAVVCFGSIASTVLIINIIFRKWLSWLHHKFGFRSKQSSAFNSTMVEERAHDQGGMRSCVCCKVGIIRPRGFVYKITATSKK